MALFHAKRYEGRAHQGGPFRKTGRNEVNVVLPEIFRINGSIGLGERSEEIDHDEILFGGAKIGQSRVEIFESAGFERRVGRLTGRNRAG